METTDLQTTDAGNGNEPPLAVAPAPEVIDGGLVATTENSVSTTLLEAGVAEAAAFSTTLDGAGVTAHLEATPHPAHGWLDTLVDEFKTLDEVMLNRLHHIVSKIRETL